jgi:hypothetical protein
MLSVSEARVSQLLSVMCRNKLNPLLLGETLTDAFCCWSHPQNYLKGGEYNDFLDFLTGKGVSLGGVWGASTISVVVLLSLTAKHARAFFNCASHHHPSLFQGSSIPTKTAPCRATSSLWLSERTSNRPSGTSGMSSPAPRRRPRPLHSSSIDAKAKAKAKRGPNRAPEHPLLVRRSAVTLQSRLRSPSPRPTRPTRKGGVVSGKRKRGQQPRCRT